MKSFSLTSLFLVVTIVALALGWWVDRSTTDEFYFLHVYAGHYGPHQDQAHPDHDSKTCGNTRVGTLSIKPGVPFYFNSPIDRNPELVVEGTTEQSGAGLACDFTVWVDDPHATFEYVQDTPVEIDKIYPFFGEFFFTISRHRDPYEINFRDYRFN